MNEEGRDHRKAVREDYNSLDTQEEEVRKENSLKCATMPEMTKKPEENVESGYHGRIDLGRDGKEGQDEGRNI